MNVGHTSDKQGVLERLLELGMVLVAFDARAAGVEVPEHLARDPQLRLNLSYRFGRPLKIDPWGVHAELTFGGVPHACRVPMSAIYLIISHVNGEPYLFPDDVPTELLNQATGALEGLNKAPSTPRKPRLQVVSDEEETPPTPNASTQPADEAPSASHKTAAENDGQPKHGAAPQKQRRRGHLRVIK